MTTDQNEIKTIFKKLQQEEKNKSQFEPSPFLKTRVLAELRTKKEISKTVLFWKKSTFSGVALAVLILMIAVFKDPSQFLAFQAHINEPTLLEIDVKALNKNTQIARAELVFPDGVRVYSQQHPQFNDDASIVFEWKSDLQDTHLPVVIKSTDKGKKQILVKFFDKNNNLVSEKTLTINFMS